MTGNLFTKIQIPVRPQISAPQNTKQSVPASVIYQPHDTFSGFEYPAAVPLSIAHTQPKGITEDAPRGRLIKENFLQSMQSTVKSYGDYCKYFYNAGFKGTGTDYSVGKINDLAIRIGSLGIATTLASSKFFPFARGMEFVGLGTWFAAMAAWPQILALPVKAKTGVDPTLKYEDSQGRRKSFIEDRQYLCFDLFKHIDKNGNLNYEAPEYELFDNIGDKLGIPRNIPNRREAIQNKFGQIAVQYNALLMLTAGVMTPVLSSIVADQLQAPLGNSIEAARTHFNENNIKNLTAKIDHILSGETVDVNNVIETLGVELDKNLNQKINEFSTRASSGTAKYISQQEEQLLTNLIEKRYYGTGFGTDILQELKTESVISRNSIPVNHQLGLDIQKITTDIGQKLQDIKVEKIRKSFDEIEKIYKKLNPDKPVDFASTKISDVISNLSTSKKGKTANYRALIARVADLENLSIQELKDAINSKDLDKLKLSKYRINTVLTEQEIWNALDDVKRIAHNTDNVFTPLAQKFATGQLQIKLLNKLKSLNIPENEIGLLDEVFEKELTKYFNKTKATLIRPEQLQKLFKIAEMNLHLKKHFDKYKAATIKDVAESVTARSWDKIPQKYFKLIGFTTDELNHLARLDAVKASELISNKFSELVKDENKLNQAISTMSKYADSAVTKEEKAFVNLVGTIDNPGLIVKAQKLTQKLLAQNSFTDELRTGFERYFISNLKAVKTKVINTIDSLGKPIQILDIFKSLNISLEPKLENGRIVGDRIVDPDKAPLIIKDFLGKDSNEFLQKMQNDKNSGKNLYYTFHEGYTDPGAYKKAVNSLIDYIKDIALQKNDISDWITKFEAQLDGYSRGIKHSKHMVGTMADTIFSHFSPATRNAIENGAKGLSDKFEKNKADMKRRFLAADSVIVRHSNFSNYDANYVYNDKLNKLVDDFFNTTNLNDAEIKSKKLVELIEERRINNFNDKEIKDAKNSVLGYINYLKNGGHFDKSPCYDCVKDVFNFNNSVNINKLLDNFFDTTNANDAKATSKHLLQLIEDKALETGAKKDLQDVINTVKGYIAHLENPVANAFNKEGCKTPFYNIINAKTVNKDIGEMTGKNTVDFMIRAAQNISSRNKWQLLVWSLLAATLGVSIVTIANIGHTNSFNPDHWKKQNKNGDKQ